MRTVLVIGAGKAGTAVAKAVRGEGHSVRVIETRPEHVAEFGHQVDRVETFRGSGTDPTDLEAAGIRSCDMVVAATGSDEVNLVAATLAKFEFGIAVVAARVVDPRNRWLFESDMGVDVVIDETHLLAELVARSVNG
ncbi:MAG: potassium channel family protein [Acidimicrobiia bacterium]